MTRATRIWIVVASLVPALSAGDALASGFYVPRFGGEKGTPASSHLSTLYFNPAGLVLDSGTRFTAEGLFAQRRASYARPQEAIDNLTVAGQDEAGTPSGAVGANAGSATLDNVAAAPFLGAATTFEQGRWVVGAGLSLSVPFGGAAKWDKNATFAGNEQYPGAVDGVQRWAAIEGTFRSIYATAGAAVAVPSQRFSLGLALNLVRSELSVVRARNVEGSDHLLTSSGERQEGRSLIDAAGWTVALGAGAMWWPTDELLVGASYQSQPGFGEMTLKGTLTNKFVGHNDPDVSEVEVRQRLPDVARLGVRYRPTAKLELRASGEYVRWSVFERQCLIDVKNPNRGCAFDDNGAVGSPDLGIQANLERDWQDAYGARAGASYWLTPTLELLGGGGWDSNAVPDDTLDAGLMDMEKGFVDVGVRVSLFDERMVVSVTFSNWMYADRTVDPRERDADGNAVTLAAPSRVPDGAGTYTQSIQLLDVGVEYAF
jgi:long-chain fatty acid transport protein